MKICDNLVSYYVPRGYDYREVLTKCGDTDIHGAEALCDDCAADPRIRADHERRARLTAEDNAWARSAGWGEF